MRDGSTKREIGFIGCVTIALILAAIVVLAVAAAGGVKL